LLDPGCFWIFDNNDNSNEAGKCIEIDQSLICENITRESQCNDKDLEPLTSLENECEIYNGKCKSKCSVLDKEGCDSRAGDGDCFFLKGSEVNGDVTPDTCVNKVCNFNNLIIYF
jgi:hypothetical protein